jgi:hypothetical protein
VTEVMNGVLESTHAIKRPEAELTQGQKDYFKTYKAFGEALIQQKKAFECNFRGGLSSSRYDKVDIDDAKFVSFG